MTLIHLWLVHRFKADALYYVTPTEDNVYQTEKMKSHGIFSDVHQEVGEIIVAEVNHQRIAELLAADRVALQRLIKKETRPPPTPRAAPRAHLAGHPPP